MARDRINSAAPARNGSMSPGETRTIIDPASQKVITLHRTSRPYVEDLCDAYNSARTRNDIQWFVDGNGSLRLGDADGWTDKRTSQLDRKQEAERQEWLRRNREAQYSDPRREAAE